MDQPELAESRHRQALGALERINWLSGSARIYWRPLVALAREISPRPLRVLDVGSGGGDVLRQLQRRARRAGLRLTLEGCDFSARAVEYARQSCAQDGADVRFFVANVLEDELPTGYDVVVCSLFLHHFTEGQATTILARMAAAARSLVMVNDLRRCFTGWLLAHVVGRLVTTSPVVHVDGPRSVAAAWTRDEVLSLAARAGLHGAACRRCWPCRFLLSWRRPPDETSEVLETSEVFRLPTRDES